MSRYRHIPNLITGARLLLVPPLIALLWLEQYTAAMVLFLVAGLSDGADGFLARRYGWTSRLGSLLDPLADKLLHVGLYLSLGLLGHLPIWLVALVIGRDVLILAGAAAYRAALGNYRVEPRALSKFNTLMQMVLVLAVIVALGGLPMPAGLIDALIYVVAATTVASGSEYVWIWSGRARDRLRALRASR
ncbi:CDP-alcohol phosphatidyltransferase family protein [Ectothiorhodospiraceae bacterium 2226]|nr:CDP-alcohol phosphatidyltransferase family protein [Ectothiorhodospiraceae bacterium 2226]